MSVWNLMRLRRVVDGMPPFNRELLALRVASVRWSIGLVGLVGIWLALATPARAAFAGRNGVLVVQPLRGRGLILVKSNGTHERRICTAVSVCGSPRRPRFTPDGRAIVFAGPAIRLIATDGSCMNCQFGVSANPAFRSGATAVTFISGGTVLQDGIDGLRQLQLRLGVRGISDAVWSGSGELAAVARGRVWIGTPGHLRSIGAGGAPSWSPDGSRLAIVRGGWITIVRVSNGSTRRLVRGSAPAFSPDGRWVAFIDRRHRVRVIRSVGGRSRAVGLVRGSAVDWQPLPAHPPACVAPAGSKVIASSPRAVVTTDASAAPGRGGLPDTAAMGCLFANGRERLLERSTFNTVDGATDYPLAALGGTYAAIVVHENNAHYGGESDTVAAFDLRTGARSGRGGEGSSCYNFGPSPNCGGIDQLVMGSDGVSAVHVDGGPTSPGADPLEVLCASPSLCLATNSFGDVLSSTSPTQGPWTPTTGARMNSGGAGGGSCPSVSLCVLASDAIYTSTDPAAGTWTRTPLPGAPNFSAVDCPSTSLCVATTVWGQVAVSTNPTGGAAAWTLEDIDAHNLTYGVSCPSTSECLVTDLEGNVVTSTNPTGGPSAWSARKVNSGMTQLSCPSTSLCVAPLFLSGVAVSTDPISGPWTSTTLGDIQALACPSASLCVEVSSDTSANASIGFSTDPPAGTWSSYNLDSAAGTLQSLSCPTTTFCVAAGYGDGHVLVSTDPTGGPGAWTPVFADKINCSLASGACGTEQIIASDRTGVHVVDQSTEFEVQTGPQLTGLALHGDTLSWSDHGSSTSAQLAH